MTTTLHAPEAATYTPTNDEGPTVAAAAPRELTQTQLTNYEPNGDFDQSRPVAHSVGHSRAGVDASFKIKATVVAQAALVEVSVVELADNTFLASRWGYVKALPDLAAVRQLVRQLGGAA